MSPEIAAIIGVLAGAMANGGIQTFQHERERRVQARVAARLFTGDLARAERDVQRIIEGGRWPDMNMPTYSREVDVWTTQRVAFAAVVDVTDYTLVAVAYQALADLPAESKPGRALTFPERAMLDRVRRCIADAYEVTSHRSAPRLQRRRARKVLSRGQ